MRAGKEYAAAIVSGERWLRRGVTLAEAAGQDHPDLAVALNNLAQLLQATNRLGEAEPLMMRAAIIELKSTAAQKHHTSNLRPILDNYEAMLEATGKTSVEARGVIDAMCKEYGVTVDREGK